VDGVLGSVVSLGEPSILLDEGLTTMNQPEDVVKFLVDHSEVVKRAMDPGDWNSLMSELAKLRRPDGTATKAEKKQAFDALLKICQNSRALVRVATPVRTRGAGSGRGADDEPDYVILLNRVFDLVGKSSPPVEEKPPQAKQQANARSGGEHVR
jgi:hypothetical protein